MSIKKSCIKCGDIFHGGLYETLCGACQMSAVVTPMFKLCPECDGAYGAEWDMCPVCYPAEIVSNTKSNETPCTKCGKSFWVYNHPALNRSARQTECPSCYEKSINRAKELKSGIQEKIDFGGIKLLPEKTPKYPVLFVTSVVPWENVFGPKPGDQIYEIDEAGKPTLKTVGDYTKSGQDAYITSAQLQAAVAALKGGATIPWPVEAVEAPEDYTEYNGPGLVELLPEMPVYDDNGVPITQTVKTPYPNQAAAEA